MFKLMYFGSDDTTLVLQLYNDSFETYSSLAEYWKIRLKSS